jgi:hypothetical protein
VEILYRLVLKRDEKDPVYIIELEEERVSNHEGHPNDSRTINSNLGL